MGLKKSCPNACKSLLLQGDVSKVMMTGMQKMRLISFLLVALTCTSVADAALYKGIDAEGKVVYSDKPFHDAEKFTPPPISVMAKEKSRQEKKTVKDEKPAEFKYISFGIVSPINNQTFQNDPDVKVSLKLKPDLNTAEKHNIWLLVDGKPVVKNTQSQSLKTGRMNRGAHKLQAQIRDEKGKVIVRSRTIVVFIHQTSAY